MSKLRILDFDIENRPLTYLGNDYTTSDVTAIAWCFVDAPEAMHCYLLGRDDPTLMLMEFRAAYNKADVVTGHYIRMHDLPIINGSLMEAHLGGLQPKMSVDTKLDLVSKGSAISASQENLAEMFGIPANKYHMSNTKWREANRLTPQGLAFTEQRVIADVRQHMLLRLALVERNLLHSPKTWRA